MAVVRAKARARWATRLRTIAALGSAARGREGEARRERGEQRPLEGHAGFSLALQVLARLRWAYPQSWGQTPRAVRVRWANSASSGSLACAPSSRPHSLAQTAATDTVDLAHTRSMHRAVDPHIRTLSGHPVLVGNAIPSIASTTTDLAPASLTKTLASMDDSRTTEHRIEPRNQGPMRWNGSRKPPPSLPLALSLPLLQVAREKGSSVSRSTRLLTRRQKMTQRAGARGSTREREKRERDAPTPSRRS